MLDWVAVGLSQDLRKAMAMPAHVDGVDLALWRSASGIVHAWGDRCPHRGMRLSHGFVRGETLSCIYHGWQFDEDGGCASIPAHPKLTPPKSICATTYKCEESGGVIWASLKDTSETPPALPDGAPVRSVEVDVPLAAVAAHFGDAAAQVIRKDDMTVVLQPVCATKSALHLLSTGDAKAASRWLEEQRSLIEGVSA